MKNNTARLTLLGLGVAVAMILSYVEFLLPPIFSSVPGIKLGLPNIIIIYLLYKLGARSAAAVSLVRVVLSALLFGTVLTMLYSLSGAILSIAVMTLIRRTGLFSTVGVSIVGAVFHNLGQILTAIIILGTREIGYYMIVLALTGTLAGIFVGILSALMLKYVRIGTMR